MVTVVDLFCTGVNSSMRPIDHHTTKYDGSLHYQFDAEIVESSENAIVIYRGTGVKVRSYRGELLSETQLVVFFYGDRYHNVVIVWNSDWTPKMHYVNIALPARWNGERVSAVDMDLDIVRKASTGEMFVDDEDEFAQHIDKFGYSDDLIEKCRSEVTRIQGAMKGRQGIFSDEIFRWRPGAAISRHLMKPL